MKNSIIVPARSGMAWRGMVRRGEARRGESHHSPGLARHGLVWCREARSGAVRRGEEYHQLQSRPGEVGRGTARRGTVKQGEVTNKRICPKCGGDLNKKITENIDRPVHNADRLAAKLSLFEFFPHIDVEEKCIKCGFYTHATVSVESGETLMATVINSEEEAGR